MTYFLQLALTIVLTTLVILLLAFMGFGVIADIKGAPFVPTSKKRYKAIEDLLIKGQKLSGKNKPRFIDIGSGSGSIVFVASKLGFDATGVEISPFLVLYSKIKAKILGNDARFICNDLFKIDLSEYDIVFSYLLPKAMKKLESKLDQELGDNCVLVSEAFTLPTWKPSHEIDRIYLYKKKAHPLK